MWSESHFRLLGYEPTPDRLASDRMWRSAVLPEDLPQVLALMERAERERESLLEAERAARAEAEGANRLKDEFLATLSHELRTPLANIVSWARVLQRKYSGEEEPLRRGLGVIVENAMAQSTLIGDLLDMSRIVRGKVTLEAQPLELVGFLEACIASHRPAAEAKGLTLALEVALGAAGAVILAEPPRLQQVLGNLLSNALKFTPAGGKVTVAAREAPGGYAIEVRDTGEGVAPEALPYIFKRFRQADGSTSRRHGGLGLGLAIVKQLIELHGGTVRAASEGVGRGGATFTLWLPAAIPAGGASVGAEAKEDSGRWRTQGELLEPESLKGLDVIAIEDDRAMLELLVRTLRGEPALRAERLPALAVTAFARDEDRERALAAGFQSVLQKPYEVAQLIAAIRQLGGANGRSDRSDAQAK